MSVAFVGNSTTGSSREAGPLRVMVVDDSVVIRIARSEMGQGSLTGLAQLVGPAG